MQIHGPFELVLFGGLGDLALRKLLPALYWLHRDTRFQGGKIICLTRQALEQDEFLARVRQALRDHVDSAQLDDSCEQAFLACLHCVQMDVTDASSFAGLAQQLTQEDINRVFYLATGSNLYTAICAGLDQAGLINSRSKVVLEKPIGQDFASAQAITKSVAQYFNESQIYRIDHYLGKETVQNLMALRFANPLFESQWSQNFIDHIQITISESLGVENRAEFYDNVGALRDMLQNHLLQLLCITAMEPPARMDADAVRDEKVKVLRSLKSMSGVGIEDRVVRGQYSAGVSHGTPVVSYREEPGVQLRSHTETFVAMKVEIDNWRWAGVPFYLRTGKRLAERGCEIVVQFKPIAHSIFPSQNKNTMANKLIFRLQPDEGIRLTLCEKKVGPGMVVWPVELSLTPSSTKQGRVPEAYERLLFDALNSNPTLFLRNDELLEAWRWVDPILQHWQEADCRPEPYTSGSWGPASATLLMARDGRLWEESRQT